MVFATILFTTWDIANHLEHFLAHWMANMVIPSNSEVNGSELPLAYSQVVPQDYSRRCLYPSQKTPYSQFMAKQHAWHHPKLHLRKIKISWACSSLLKDCKKAFSSCNNIFYIKNWTNDIAYTGRKTGNVYFTQYLLIYITIFQGTSLP